MSNTIINKKIPLTSLGLEELKKEYERLVKEKRPTVIERLVNSRKIGDLSEESEDPQARQELSFVDGRIDELEKIINNVLIIDDGHDNCQEIKLGCKVTVKSDKGERIFHLVGEWEANPAEAKISHQSPLGQSLLGRKLGEKVEFNAPAGKIVYTVAKID